MKRCSSSAFGAHSVQSDSSNKIYTVEISDTGEHTCSCPAFAIQNNKRVSNGGIRDYLCKHIRSVQSAGGCPWTENHPTQQKYPDICPLCASPTEYSDTVTEDPSDDQMNDALAGLMAIRDRLK